MASSTSKIGKLRKWNIHFYWSKIYSIMHVLSNPFWYFHHGVLGHHWFEVLFCTKQTPSHCTTKCWLAIVLKIFSIVTMRAQHSVAIDEPSFQHPSLTRSTWPIWGVDIHEFHSEVPDYHTSSSHQTRMTTGWCAISSSDLTLRISNLNFQLGPENLIKSDTALHPRKLSNFLLMH